MADESHSSVPCMFRWVNTWKRRGRVARRSLGLWSTGFGLDPENPWKLQVLGVLKIPQSLLQQSQVGKLNREVMGDQSVDSGFEDAGRVAH